MQETAYIFESEKTSQSMAVSGESSISDGLIDLLIKSNLVCRWILTPFVEKPGKMKTSI